MLGISCVAAQLAAFQEGLSSVELVSLPICYLRTERVNFQTRIVPVISYGYESWSVAVKEQHCLMVLRALRIFGPK
jgi:hypothetical protein